MKAAFSNHKKISNINSRCRPNCVGCSITLQPTGPPNINNNMKVSLYRKYNEGHSCEEAMTFYKDVVFGIKHRWTAKQTYGDSKTMKIADPEKVGHKIMHMGLPLTKTFELCGCDGDVKMAKNGSCGDTTPSTSSEEKKSDEDDRKKNKKSSNNKNNKANEYALWITADSKDHADKLIADLSGDGGTITMPMSNKFWGEYFGMCMDRFDTQWMISHPLEKKDQPVIDSDYGDGNLQVNVYRSFKGNCEEAFEFYKKVFGGEFTWKGTYDNAPSGSEFSPKDTTDMAKIMHMSLPITNQFTLMGCDIFGMTSEEEEGKVDYTSFEEESCAWARYSASLTVTSKEDADKVFKALQSDGGKVVMPLDDMFWGDYFGVVSDKFGLSWNISYNSMNAKLIAEGNQVATAVTNEVSKKNKMKVNIYRKFQGNCEEAFLFYKTVFGGDFSWKVEWSKAPVDTILNLERDGNLIMHIGLPLTENIELMGCDEVPMKANAHVVNMDDDDDGDDDTGSSNKRQKTQNGGSAKIASTAITKNTQISVCPESKEHADYLMAKLSADGGVVQIPMGQMFWGSYFGACLDKFGTAWMFDYFNETPSSSKKEEGN